MIASGSPKARRLNVEIRGVQHSPSGIANAYPPRGVADSEVDRGRLQWRYRRINAHLKEIDIPTVLHHFLLHSRKQHIDALEGRIEGDVPDYCGASGISSSARTAWRSAGD
jgi:hypothetical protein